MTPRLLMVVLPGQVTDALRVMPALIAVVRAEAAVARLASFHPLPPPRFGQAGRAVFDTDGEMARISGAVSDRLLSAVRCFHDVTTELVVRFGTPSREVLTELEAYAPAFVAFLAPRRTRPLARLEAWLLRRRVAHRCAARIVVLDTATPPRRRSPLARQALGAPGVSNAGSTR